MLTLLQTIARAVTPIVLDIYDREDAQSLLQFLSRTTGNPQREKKVILEWWTVFPELRKWVGDRKTQRAFQDKLEIESEPYEITFDFDRIEIERGSALVRAEEMAPQIAQAFVRGKVDLAYRVLKLNSLSYDGQDFFDTDHTHPDGSVYSNLLTRGTETPARASDAAPTPLEVREELKVVMAQLQENSIIRNTLLSTNEVRQNLVVISRNFETWSAFHDLLTEEELNGMPNRFRGAFNLLRDYDPPAGDELSYDVIHAVPGGPRPTIFVATREPDGLEFDTSQEFRNRYIPFGMDAEYGVGAGFPQTSVRVVAP